MEYFEGSQEMKLFSNGNLTALGGTLLAIGGTVIVICSAAYSFNKWLFIFGIFIGVFMLAIASASLKSLVLGIKPFTNDPLGWRKAKKSYETQEDSDKVPKKGDQP